MKKSSAALRVLGLLSLLLPAGLNADPAPGGPSDVSDALTRLPFVSVADAINDMPRPVTNGTAPTITAQPASQSVATGAAVTLTVVASGTPAPSYRWAKYGRFISGANSASYTIAAAKPADAGAYTVTVYNGAGQARSNAATLSVAAAGTVTAAPQSASLATGATANFSVTAVGTGLSYQWQFNGLPIPGATSSTYTLANTGPGASGPFTVVISNASGAIAAEVATLTVTTNARLTNLSVRGLVGAADEVLIVGFVSVGTGTKQIVLRGVGPTLGTQFSVAGALTKPTLTLYGATGKTLDANSSWGGTSALTQAFAQVGAFALPAASADAALLETLAPGLYSAHVTGVGGATGVALAEVYDADKGAPTATLVNISARAFVANGGNILIAGFVVAGPSSETVLIRGVGPSLGGLFGLHKALGATQISLFDSKGNVITANAGWGDNPLITSTNTQVGAFEFMPHSQDSALLVTIPPGAYSAQVSGPNGATGLGMVEVYEVLH